MDLILFDRYLVFIYLIHPHSSIQILDSIGVEYGDELFDMGHGIHHVPYVTG